MESFTLVSNLVVTEKALNETIAKLLPDHNDLINKIKVDKEKFLQEKKVLEEAEKQAKIEKLVNDSKVDDTGAKGIIGGEPSDEQSKERRNFVKSVSILLHLSSIFSSFVCLYAFYSLIEVFRLLLLRHT